MRVSRLVLILMASAAALLIVAAVFGPAVMARFGGGSGGGDDRLSIAIATPNMLLTMIDQAQEAERAQTAQDGINQAIATGENASSDAVDVQDGEVTNEPENAVSEAPAHSMNAAAMRAFYQSSLDQLGNELAGSLTRSRRFEVVDSSRVAAALRDIGSERTNGGEQKSFLQSLMFWRRTETRESSDATGTVQRQTQTSAGVQAQGTNFDPADLASAGRELGADYVIFVAITDTNQDDITYRRTREPYSTRINHEFHLSPTFIYRVFDVRSGAVIASDETRITPAIIQRVEVDTHRHTMLRDLQLRTSEAISREVTRVLIDELAPARIVSADPEFIINRGAADGISEGQIYEVMREGEAVRDIVTDESGRVSERASLGRRRSPVGQVRILRVEDTFATAAPMEGDVKVSDIVVITAPQSRGVTLAGGGASSSGVGPLGAQAIRDRERGGVTRERIAVGTMRVELLEPRVWRAPPAMDVTLSRRMSDNLSADRRLEIVPRADIERLMEERRMAAASQGNRDVDVVVGTATAGYLMIGDVRLNARRAGQTISVGGQSRETNVTSRLVGEGTFRIQTFEGAQVNAVRVSVERPGSPTDSAAVNTLLEAVAAEASAKLLVALFPIEVAAVSGDRITLTRGAEAGLQVGTRLRAFRVGEPVIDRYTHAVVAEGARQHVGDLVVVDAPNGSATARFASRPFSIAPNDVVEITSGAVAAASTPSTTRRPAAAPAATPSQQTQTVQW